MSCFRKGSYRMVAAALAAALDQWEEKEKTREPGHGQFLAGIETFESALIEEMKMDNPRFNEHRFWEEVESLRTHLSRD